MPIATPVTWNDVSAAVSLLGPLVNASGFLDNVLVRCDPTNCHYQSGPKYRAARFALDGHGEVTWYLLESDRPTGPWQLFCVDAFALAETP